MTTWRLASAAAAARTWDSKLDGPKHGAMTSGGISSRALVPPRASAGAIATGRATGPGGERGVGCVEHPREGGPLEQRQVGGEDQDRVGAGVESRLSSEPKRGIQALVSLEQGQGAELTCDVRHRADRCSPRGHALPAAIPRGCGECGAACQGAAPHAPPHRGRRPGEPCLRRGSGGAPRRRPDRGSTSDPVRSIPCAPPPHGRRWRRGITAGKRAYWSIVDIIGAEWLLMRMLPRLGRSLLAFALILVLAVACVTVTTGPTSGPGAVPTGPSGGGAQPTAAPGGGGGGGIPTLPVSIPSIVIPSFALPSLPSFAIPSFAIPSVRAAQLRDPQLRHPVVRGAQLRDPIDGRGGWGLPHREHR